jgi:hypothetical protein
LAKLRNRNGDRIYNVTVLEAKKSLLNGASKTPVRLHLGAEYPLDEQTALE